MDTQSNYLKFKSSLPWDIANDKYFAYEIIKNVPFEILLASISNWHSFFTKEASSQVITHFLKCLILLDFFMYICIAFCIGHFYLSFLLFHFIFSGKRGYLAPYSITHFF